MTASDFASYSSSVKATSRDAWIGSIVWYMVSETRVRFTDLEAALHGAGLSNFVPRKPRDEDVFRRIAPNGHKRKVATNVADVHINYLIRPVKRGGGTCVKQIVAETVDGGGESLAYEPVFELKYLDGAHDLTVTPLVQPADPIAEQIADDVVADYQANRGWLDATAVRTIIRKVMEASKATNVRPTGGIYFVMNDYVSNVDALENFSSQIPGCHVHSLPLIADSKQKEMIRRAYEAESIGEVDAMLVEISEILAKPDATVDFKKYAAYSSKFAYALEKTKDYEELLEDTLDTTNSKLTILQKTMAELLKRTT